MIDLVGQRMGRRCVAISDWDESLDPIVEDRLVPCTVCVAFDRGDQVLVQYDNGCLEAVRAHELVPL